MAPNDKDLTSLFVIVWLGAQKDPHLSLVLIQSGRQRERAAESAGPSRRLRADRRGLLWAGQGVRPGAPHRLLQDLPLPRLHRGAHRHRDGLKLHSLEVKYNLRVLVES